MHKDYLRFVPDSFLGVTASPGAPLRFIRYRNQIGRFIAVPACENVVIWDLKTKLKVLTFPGEHHAVSALAYWPGEPDQLIAAGYADGTVKLFSLTTGQLHTSFSGHRSAVSCLAFDQKSTRLASGGKDSSIHIWDHFMEEGLFRLMGHKNAITQCYFLTRYNNILISSSKDMQIKFWFLDIQHCFQTIMGSKEEIWDFIVLKNENLMISGSTNEMLTVWSLEEVEENDDKSDLKRSKRDETHDDEQTFIEAKSIDIPFEVKQIGQIARKSGNHRLYSMAADPTKEVFCYHASDSILELARLSHEEEIKKKLKKRLKRERLKGDTMEAETCSSDPTVSDLFTKLPHIKVTTPSGKPAIIKAADLFVKKDKILIATLQVDNSIYLHSCDVKTGTLLETRPVLFEGHRSPPFVLCYSHINNILVSVGADSLQLWDIVAKKCLRNQSCQHPITCALYAPKEKFIISGTKGGSLEIYEASTLETVFSQEAHSGVLHSICLHSNRNMVISGGQDKLVKFWSLKTGGKTEISLKELQSYTMMDEALCVKCSPENTEEKKQVIAIALFNSHVTLFHLDTMKHLFDLVGHSQPVRCMDISHDNQIIATGAGDKNIRLWGLTYGQCLRSIFAHDSSVTCIKFCPNSHIFFSGSLDNTIKQWDGDTYEKIVTLKGHQGGVNDLVIYNNGTKLASCSQDFSIRTWEESDEVLLIEEEKEKEMDEAILKENILQDMVPPIGNEEEAGTAGKNTPITLELADHLMEYIDLFDEEMAKLKEYRLACKSSGKKLPQPPAHPLLKANNTTDPLKFMALMLVKAKLSEMERALTKLPFHYCQRLLEIIALLLEKGWEVERASRYALILLKYNYNQMKVGASFIPTLKKLNQHMVPATQKLLDLAGFNFAALNYIHEQVTNGYETLPSSPFWSSAQK